MHIRARFAVGGGHTHVRIFVGKGPEFTHAKSGDLTFTNEEWEVVRRQWERLGWEIVDDTKV